MLLSAAWTSALAVSAMSVHPASQLVGVRDSLASTHPLAPVSSAQPLNVDDESETEALIAKAHNLTNLTAADSAPFRFRATLFFYDPSGDARLPPVKGSYAFTWSTLSKWREDADLLHLKQTEVANGATLWIKRNAPYPSFGYWWTRNAIGITRGVVYHFDSRTHIEISQVSGRNVVCARNGGTHVQRELCLDTATSLPVAQYDATLHLQILFANWTPWGSHWYPGQFEHFPERSSSFEWKLKTYLMLHRNRAGSCRPRAQCRATGVQTCDQRESAMQSRTRHFPTRLRRFKAMRRRSLERSYTV